MPSDVVFRERICLYEDLSDDEKGGGTEASKVITSDETVANWWKTTYADMKNAQRTGLQNGINRIVYVVPYAKVMPMLVGLVFVLLHLELDRQSLMEDSKTPTVEIRIPRSLAELRDALQAILHPRNQQLGNRPCKIQNVGLPSAMFSMESLETGLKFYGTLAPVTP